MISVIALITCVVHGVMTSRKSRASDGCLLRIDSNCDMEGKLYVCDMPVSPQLLTI